MFVGRLEVLMRMCGSGDVCTVRPGVVRAGNIRLIQCSQGFESTMTRLGSARAMKLS